MKKSRSILILIVISLLLAACGYDQPETTAIPSQEVVVKTPTLAATPTTTEVPPMVLNVCIAEEPAGLYRYDGYEGIAKQSVFAAIYTDMLETGSDTDQNMFFESIPTEENGGILLQTVPVKVGQPVLDASGKVVYLAEGTKIEHAINYSIENPVTWNFEQDYHMNQFTVTFKLLPGLKWSNGEALVAEDFVFSYHLAERSGLGHYQWSIDRTDSLVAADEHTLVWTGIPGFVPRSLKDILWQPLPSHQLRDFSDSELLTSDLTTRSPLGWGAYRLVGWDAGSQIALEKNPNFVLSSQGLPAYDQLIFHVEPNLDAALEQLANGQCDILDKTYQLEGMEKSQLEILAANHKLVLEDWQPVQQLVFGIQPATFDDGMYNAWTSERQDLFGNLETRKAIAACIDADSLVSEYMAEHLPQDLLPAMESLPANSPDANNAYLEEIGWVLTSDDSGVMRRAQGVPNVLEDAPLSFGLYLGQSQVDQGIAEKIIERLGRCYIPVARLSAPLAELYRPGPEGPLFGRNFDLALVSWQPEHMNYCQLYTSDQIPSSINSWVGTNLAGLNSAEFDEACWQTSTRLVGAESQDDAQLMLDYLPAIVMMPQYRVWVSSNRISVPENSTFVDLWKFSPVQ